MKVKLRIQMISGEWDTFNNVNFPTCKTVEKIRAWFNKSIGFIAIGGALLRSEHIERIDITDHETLELDERLQEYRGKNPEFKLEK